MFRDLWSVADWQDWQMQQDLRQSDLDRLMADLQALLDAAFEGIDPW